MMRNLDLPGVVIPYSRGGKHPRGGDGLLGDVRVIGEPLPRLRDHGWAPNPAHGRLQELQGQRHLVQRHSSRVLLLAKSIIFEAHT